MTGKFDFLYVGIWFDVENCKFVVKIKSSFSIRFQLVSSDYVIHLFSLCIFFFRKTENFDVSATERLR